MKTLLALLLATLTAAAPTLEWDAVSGATGYKLYYGTVSSNYTQVVDAGRYTSNRITGLQLGQRYFFAVSAYNTNAESAPSSQISYVETNTATALVTNWLHVGVTIEKAQMLLGPWDYFGSMSSNVNIGMSTGKQVIYFGLSNEFYRARMTIVKTNL